MPFVQPNGSGVGGGALRGLRVVDCSVTMAGLRATGLMAGYGADVVWIEPPGGSPLRRQSPESASVFNRNKRSVILDLRGQHPDQDHLLGMLAEADVLVDTWVPGDAAALGLGPDDVRLANPGLVTCSITAFGCDGPSRDIAARDALVHALVGTMAEQAGHREGPIFEGLPQASLGAAYLAFLGTLAALYRRSQDGGGRHVDTSLLDGALAYHSMLWSESDASVAAMAAQGVGQNSTAGTRLITRSFVCSDDQYIGIHTGAVGAFGRLMKVLDLDDRIPPSASGLDMGAPLTTEQIALLETELHSRIAAKPRAHWVDVLRQAEVCAIEHLLPGEVFDQPQARHNQMVVEIDDPVLGLVQQVAPAAKFPSLGPVGLTPAPTPGQHTRSALARPWDGEPFDDRGAERRAGTTGSDGRSSQTDRPLLEGVKILDLGAYFAGPYSSRLLADLGADVIKLEPTQGDQLRGIDQCFFPAQAGKRSIAMNLKAPGVRPVIEALLDWVDVVHHNLRPGAAERLGLSYDDVRSTHPELVYLYAPGWGSGGPDMLRQSFAPMMSGYVGVTFEAAGQFNEPLPTPCNEDPGNGMLGAACILIGLLHRRRTAQGIYIENPQLNAAMSHVAHIVRRVDHAGNAGEVMGAARLDTLQYGFGPFERLYRTADGWICVAALEEADRAALAQVLETDLADVMAARIEQKETAAWLSAFEAAGVPAVEPVARHTHAFLNDPENRRTGRVAECLHPTKGNVRELAHLVRVSGSANPPHRLAPDLGAHTESILCAMGLAHEEIADLRAHGAIRP